MQVLQAANTGITSLQSLVSSAQSVANQVLQTPVGYSTKSSVSTTAISGANANNLLGTGTGYTDATFAGATATGTITAAFVNVSSTGTVVDNDDLASSVADHLRYAARRYRQQHLERPGLRQHHQRLHAGRQRHHHHLLDRDHEFDRFGRFRLHHRHRRRLDRFGRTVLSDIDAITGSATASSITGGKLGAADRPHQQPGDHRQRQRADRDSASPAASPRPAPAAPPPPPRWPAPRCCRAPLASSVGALSAGFTAGDTLTVDGKTLTFVTGTAGANQISTGGTVASLLAAIDTASGSGTASSVSGGAIVLHTGTNNASLSISSSDSAALTALGLTGGVTQAADRHFVDA